MAIATDFLYPNAKYTAFPFWFWNGNLREEEIRRQILDFKTKGIDGFILHPRIGIPKEIPYLSERFFELVRFGVKTAKELEMKVILYDEGMYPSGSANGQVVRDHPEFAAKGIYVCPVDEFIQRTDRFQKILLSFNDQRDVPYYLVHEDSLGTIRGIHFGQDDFEPDAPRASDLLDAKAMAYFMKLTHERYLEELGSYFGDTIIAFFTDEPAILGRNYKAGMEPYNDELGKLLDRAGITLIDIAQMLLGNATSEISNIFQECVIKLLEKNYYQPISKWCIQNNIALTGHPHDAHDIGLLKYLQIPGQDVVWRWIAPEEKLGIKGYESVTGKCAPDAARHAGQSRVLNECFGCCGKDDMQWSFSIEDMKWYLDWLFIRGTNLIVPHAFFYSLEGKRIEDRAPDVGPNNLWWVHFNIISDYIKRVSYLMSDITNQTNIAILSQKNHLPFKGIEKFWEQQLEFNYLEDTYILNHDFSCENGHLNIRNQAYDVLIIENQYPYKEEVMESLKKFISEGGQIICIESDQNLSNICSEVSQIFNGSYKIGGIGREGVRYTEFVKEGVRFCGFANEGDNPSTIILTSREKGQISEEFVEVWDPWNGTIKKLKVNDGKLVLTLGYRELLFLTSDSNRATDFWKREELVTEMENLIIDVASDNSDICGIGSWTENPNLREFSGTIVYTLSFDKQLLSPLMPHQKILLDLGEVKNIAMIKVNGLQKDLRFWKPYHFILTAKDLMENIITVEVTNTLSNQLEKSLLPSGLLSSPRCYLV